MEPIVSFVLTKAAETVISLLVEETTRETVISKLKRDPVKIAFKQALGKAIGRYAKEDRLALVKPLLKQNGLLTTPIVAAELAKLVNFKGEPDVEMVGKYWRDELDAPPVWRNFTNEALVLFQFIKEELQESAVFQPVFQLKTLDAIAAEMQTATDSLLEVERLLNSLLSLLDSRFGSLVQAMANIPIDIRGQIRDFTAYIAEKTSGFVGREFIIQEINDFIVNNPRGYFFLYGDPGIGKTAIAAKLVKDNGYIHHFNIRSEGINKQRDFLRNVCAQLIAIYGLSYSSLPPETMQDTGILNKLLNEVSGKIGTTGKCVIVVDALDEADDLAPSSGANVLSLPRTLPLGVFIIVTLRRERNETLQLRIDIPEQKEREIKQDEANNIADIREYITAQIHNAGIQVYIAKQQIDNDLFIDHLVDKAQGNFMYLRFVLPEIEHGAYADLTLQRIPTGLLNYYEDHWRRIRHQDELDWFEHKLPVVIALTIVKEPVSIELLATFSHIKVISKIRAVLRDFDQFIYKSDVNYDASKGQQRYRWYHYSFFEFIADKEEIVDERVDLKAAYKKGAQAMLHDLKDNSLGDMT